MQARNEIILHEKQSELEVPPGGAEPKIGLHWLEEESLNLSPKP